MPKSEYTEEHKLFISSIANECCSYQELTQKFNNHFSLNKSVGALQQYCTKVCHIHVNTDKNKTHFTDKQTQWLLDTYSSVNSYAELTKLFNQEFHTDKTISQISDKCCKGLKLKGMNNITKYKAGDLNQKEQLPIGTIRKTPAGTYIKVKDDKGANISGYAEPYWIPIQKKIWQDTFGKISDKCMVIFLDCNKNNLSLSNLYCIDRRISAVMAKNKWYSTNAELTLTAIKYCELFYKLKDRKMS